MKFGIQVLPYTRYGNPGELLDLMQAAEQAGFASAALGEHIFTPNSHPHIAEFAKWESIVVAGAILGVTRKMRIQFNILLLPLRNPVLLARQLSTLDVVYGGRLIVGLGMGWLREEFEAMNVKFEDRAGMFEEYVRAIKILWTEQAPSFEGKHLSFRSVTFDPRPLQKPHPPLWIGGHSPRALERSATLGDGLHLEPAPLDVLKNNIDTVRAHLRRLGKDENGFTFSYAVPFKEEPELWVRQNIARGRPPQPCIDPDRSRALEQIEEYAAMGLKHLVIRFNGRNLQEVKDNMLQFKAAAM